ncbi:MAG: hypothetical protein NVS9B15_20200 [Acidobacteriaceae bacterium]
MFAPELREKLKGKEGRVVTVEYDIWSDFGKMRRYDEKSIDGLLLNGKEGYRVSGGIGGQVLPDSGQELECW